MKTVSPSQARDFASRVKGAVRENFNQSAQIYRAFEEKRGFFRDLTAVLARWMNLPEEATILDIGCGNGASCVALREACNATIYGIDLSETMIADAHRRLRDSHVHFIVGDGENLDMLRDTPLFDAAMYNASLFVFPNPERSLAQAGNHLKIGGKIGFSFYPRLYSAEFPDLLGRAYEKKGWPLPKFRTITSWDKACRALETLFGNLKTTTYEMAGDISFLIDFFSIPAQSASLFPKLPYEKRAEKVKELFNALNAEGAPFTIGWDMAMAVKRQG